MNTSCEQIEALQELQEIDIEYVQTKRKFEEMPQRAQIVEVRKKLNELEAKQTTIKDMLARCRLKIDEIDKKDASLQKRAKELQENIEDSNDFRNIEKKTKELAGVEKQRKECEERLSADIDQEAKIKKLLEQIVEAINKMSVKEASLIESFKLSGGDLQQKLHNLENKRNSAMAQLSDEHLTEYKRALSAGAGVAICKLCGDKCSVCRSKLPEVRLLQVKKEAPLTLCPNCKRLMIVNEG